MARKKKNDIAVRENSPLDTIIGPGSLFVGTMKAEKSVRIDGIFKGELYCSGFLVINQSAEIDAQIEGMDVYINGVVRGTVRAERVQFDSEARLFGDVYTHTLSIVEGAIFHGRSMPLEEGEQDDRNGPTPERQLLSS